MELLRKSGMSEDQIREICKAFSQSPKVTLGASSKSTCSSASSSSSSSSPDEEEPLPKRTRQVTPLVKLRLPFLEMVDTSVVKDQALPLEHPDQELPLGHQDQALPLEHPVESEHPPGEITVNGNPSMVVLRQSDQQIRCGRTPLMLRNQHP